QPHGNGDDRGREHRNADALVELATHSLDTGTVPQHGSVRPHVQVTTTLETLQGLSARPRARWRSRCPSQPRPFSGSHAIVRSRGSCSARTPPWLTPAARSASFPEAVGGCWTPATSIAAGPVASARPPGAPPTMSSTGRRVARPIFRT